MIPGFPLRCVLFFAAICCLGQEGPQSHATSEKLPFTVFREADKDRHFVPSGQIGDAQAIKVIEGVNDKPKSGKECIRIEFDAGQANGEKWAGVYWQQPDFNFGSVADAGYNLRAASKLTFWARGAKGGEQIEVKAGGIKGTYPDSFDMPLKQFKVSRSWKKFTLPLNDKDLSYVIGGFFLSLTKKDNPAGAVLYLDDIIYE